MLHASTGDLAGLLAKIMIWVARHRKHLGLWVKAKTVYRNKRIRVSMAYLFRIKIKGKYLLVRGNRIPDQYQPVGGVYKFTEGARSTFNELEVTHDVFVPYDEDSKNDLRLVLQKGSKLPDFLKWFDSKHDRETDPWREFFDEVIRTGILDQQVFPHTKYTWLRSESDGIRFSPYLQIHEYLHSDIYEWEPVSKEQQIAMERLMETESDRYKFATEHDIRTRGASIGIRIGDHTAKILGGV